jgi:hypothetical protein
MNMHTIPARRGKARAPALTALVGGAVTKTRGTPVVAEPGWDVFLFYPDHKGGPHLSRYPVVAWGIVLDPDRAFAESVVPVTIDNEVNFFLSGNAYAGRSDDYAVPPLLRDPRGRFYVNGQERPFKDEAEALARCLAAHKKHEEKKAEREGALTDQKA